MIGLVIIFLILYIYVVFILPISIFLYLFPYIPYWIFRHRNRMLRREYRCSTYYHSYSLSNVVINDEVVNFLGTQTNYRQNTTGSDSPHIVYVPRKFVKGGCYGAHFSTVKETDSVEWNTFICVANMMGYEVVIEKTNEKDLEE